MNVSERWHRASLYSLMTAVAIGIVGLLVTVSPVFRPGYLRTASLVFIGSCVVIAALMVAWYWLLKALGK